MGVRRDGRAVFNVLRIRDLPADAAVLVTCKGRKKGCRFESRTVSHGAGALDLLKALKRVKLKPGAVLTVRMTAADGQLKVVRYVVGRRLAVRVAYRCGVTGGALKACR
jgi:hypothetical protein